MAEPYVGILDLGMGNLFSVRTACDHVGMRSRVIVEAGEIDQAAGLILPGVGGFPVAMRTLEAAGLRRAIQDAAARQLPILGICLGHQLLFGASHELGETPGLGLIPGKVVRFQQGGRRPLKVPHIGWEGLDPTTGSEWDRSILAGTPKGEPMYYVHSYYAVPDSASDLTATSEYGGVTFCASVQRDSVHGVQFHPERSGTAGLRLYSNFRRLVEGRK